jgi:asparagine synthase (glutamine-hydrolysing)
LAHRRLSVIDLSGAAHQPMVSDDGHCAIVFNGEVYNYKSLRTELEPRGYKFHSESDTEVVLNAYRAWGEQCVTRFNGMFAFAIYDEAPSQRGPTLFLARDRAGKKPLYYAHNENRFEFASELKAIEARGGLDARALNYYFALGYVPGDLCLAQGVKKLPPAHAARLRLDNHRLDVWKYWDLPPNHAEPSVSGGTLADRAEELFVDAVGLRLVSDVPLGVLLSGGLDSSLVVAAAVRQSAKAVKTFTVAFPGSRYDESTYAGRVARHFSTEHHVLQVPRPSLDVIDDLAPLVDEPIADSSLIPAFMVSRLTRQHVTVALGGDGGDELFGGYSDYPTSLADQRRVGWLPRPLLSAAAHMAAQLPAGVRGRNRLASWRGGPLQQMIWGSPYFDIELRKRILSKDFRLKFDFALDEPEQWLLGLFRKGQDPVDSMTRTHFGSILPDDFLVKIDRASMAVGLEMRAPFLDHRLVEFAFGEIPSNWKVGDGETRRIERILARRMLPDDLDIDRKQGFSIPLDDWLRADGCARVRQYTRDLPEMIDRAEVERLIAGEMRGRANGARLYSLMMLGSASKNNGWG